MQFPLVCEAPMARVAAPKVTLAVNGVATAVDEKKFPAALGVNVKVEPLAPVMMILTPLLLTPLQLVGSCAVG